MKPLQTNHLEGTFEAKLVSVVDSNLSKNVIKNIRVFMYSNCYISLFRVKLFYFSSTLRYFKEYEYNFDNVWVAKLFRWFSLKFVAIIHPYVVIFCTKVHRKHYSKYDQGIMS